VTISAAYRDAQHDVVNDVCGMAAVGIDMARRVVRHRASNIAATTEGVLPAVLTLPTCAFFLPALHRRCHLLRFL